MLKIQQFISRIKSDMIKTNEKALDIPTEFVRK